MRGRLEYSESKVARDAVGQFKTLLESAVESVEDRNRIRENNEGVIMNTNEEYNDSEFPGLITDKEKSELVGTLNPPEGQSVKERAFLLGIENNYLREKIKKAEPGERLESLKKYLALVERAYENIKRRTSQDSKRLKNG